MSPDGKKGGSGAALDRDGTAPVLRLSGVRKEYGGYVALDGVSLEVMPGEIVAVMGPSGSGKSTLLNLVAGLDRPTAGSVEVYGRHVERLNEKQLSRYRRDSIGMVFQFFNLLDDLPALDNAALAGQLAGSRAGRARKRALELFEQLGIADRRDLYPNQLSGGQRQRVAVARALMNQPALLLADEPTGALDSRTGEQVMDLFADLNRMGQTLLMVTHDERLALRSAHRLIDLADGRLAGERRPEPLG